MTVCDCVKIQAATLQLITFGITCLSRYITPNGKSDNQ